MRPIQQIWVVALTRNPKISSYCFSITYINNEPNRKYIFYKDKWIIKHNYVPLEGNIFIIII